MQTLPRPQTSPTPSRPLRHDSQLPKPGRRRRFSPLMLIGIIVTLLIAVGAGTFLVTRPHTGSNAAAAVNMNCTLIVPPNPLTAQGLATPWQLVATDPAQGPCNQANKTQTTFVQGAVFDPATGQISIYNPLVVDQGTQPAAAPVVPTLPNGAVVALWGGSNATTITLQDTQGSLQAGNCVNGLNDSAFGQFWHCNAPVFFRAANQAIRQGRLVPPPIGMANDGKPCPTVSDFSLVDMDPHDNVTTTYLVTGNGQTAQMTTANTAALQNAQAIANGSDERLLAVAVDGALGCTPWMAPDLADPGHMVPALPLNELQAATRQAAPQALVPNRDPMVLVNGNRNLQKLNLYRVGVNEPQVINPFISSTRTYCGNLRRIAPARLQLDANVELQRPSADAAAANSLATFLAQRFVATYGANGLNCVGLLKQPDPITVQTDGNGVAISAMINGVALGNGNGGGNGGGTTNAPNCTVNGTAVAGCAGTVTINGQTCTLSFANNTVSVNCPAGMQGGPPVGGQQGMNGNGGQQGPTAKPGVQPGGPDGGQGKRIAPGNPQAQP